VWIIQPTRIEGRWDHGHQEFYLAQGIGSGGHGVGLEGGPGDRGHARLVLHNPIADPIPDLKATPFHTLSLLAEIGRLPRLTPPACLLLAQSSAADDASAIIALACCGSSLLSPTALSARYAEGQRASRSPCGDSRMSSVHRAVSRCLGREECRVDWVGSGATTAAYR